MKKIIVSLIFLILFVGVFCASETVSAAGPAVTVLPDSSSNTVGQQFNFDVSVKTDGAKVCAVKGTLNLENLSCKSISVDSGVMAQTAPTCESSAFILGVPGCTTQDKILFTITVSGVSAGQAKADFFGVNVIGEGTSLSNSWEGGIYNIVAAALPASARGTALASEISPSAETVQPENQPLIQPETQPAANFLPAGVGVASLVSSMGSFLTNSTLLTAFVIIIILLAMWWAFSKFSDRKKSEQ